MCLQCTAKAEIIVKDVIPGYLLMQSTVDCKEWPKGYYGLVQCNDPTFIWDGEPILDPTFNISDKILENLIGDNAWILSNKFFKRVEEIEPHFKCSPEKGYKLIQACKKAGYNEKKHGLRLLCWLIHHMAVKISKEKNERFTRVKSEIVS